MLRKNKPILYDPLIIQRVKQYLEENVHQTYVDVSVMAKQLQDRYREYNRRKSGPFRLLVEQAYKTVLHSYGLDSNPSSDDNNSEVEMMDDNSTNSNQMNNMLTNLYNKGNINRNTTGNVPNLSSNADKAIDISSDDSEDDNGGTNGKPPDNSALKLSKEVLVTKLAVNDAAQSNKTSNQNPAKITVTPDLPRVGLLHLKTTSQPPTATTEKSASKKRKLETLLQQNEWPNSTGNGHIPKNFLNSSHMTRGRRFKKEIIPETAQFTFSQIGGQEKILKELCELLFHYRNPQIYYHIGLSAPRGILLHGPTGCGKSMLAEAIAGTLELPLLRVPATELIAGLSGESEERIREVFEQAAYFAPCVLFIDEIDAISSNRINAQKDMERRIVSQLISSLDGLENMENGDLVLIIGATNRPEALDPALRRVGRFDHEIALGIPDRKGREEILRVICEKLVLEENFDYDKIAELTPGFVAGDLQALAFRAASIAVKRKYFTQIRKRQAELEKNIEIVDLLDENPGENDQINTKENKETESAEENQTEKQEKTESIEKKSDENEPKSQTESLDTNAMDVDEDKANEENKETTQDKETGTKISENTELSKKEEETVASKDSEALKTDKKLVEIPHTKKDPSLLELLHWLHGAFCDIKEKDLSDLCLKMTDFTDAVKILQPSAKREGFITVPDVTWDNIGSLKNIRSELQLAVLAPVKYPERLKALGLTTASGVLLFGPPGCGKTLLAKAIANEAGINFISVKGPELMNMYVGESERAVRTCFQRARNSAPCVIFFDEFDSLCPKRSEGNESGSGTRIVNQLLTEMDGIEDRKGVYLLAATNRPDIIDPAILRPGRLDTVLYVGFPERKDRIEILEALTKNRSKPLLDESVHFDNIADLTDGFTGADLAGLLRQASFIALRDSMNIVQIKPEDLKLTLQHFLDALRLIKPSVSPEERRIYENLRLKYAAPRSNTK
ncbi:nuclear valosin-containing protein-like [Condylostylus longicornis]|uniref:nuclear valosin-containing protein-like n=1 Tax=Condylostylus longicornis TaxID=2530218 RepID=UPI00244DDE16|nr:nuclear valosin-containing protein-like [Condylostylus longicornis]